MGTDYYKLLGIDKNADENAIRKAYKKMALKWHPDRNNGSREASEKFKEISEAFEVLSDKKKRTIYNQLSEAGLEGGGVSPSGAGAGMGRSGFPSNPGGAFSGGAKTFTFSMGPGGGFSGPGGDRFNPPDPEKIFK
ncbi:DnaJ-domain-containing protein [Gymnopus androsaceus JB14]|uniref:DnaJ-domain-containing protein n=1 Tax=Gymnopus androsaceus JB14 TaxID=1447944 RepID=A0A6A4GQE1_9AGAR|nr:DnaJ-domain-containing protein [Gymnopus androsaceus JB14]